MKKKLLAGLIALSLATLMPQTSHVLFAEDFGANEDYYWNLCSKPTEDPQVSATCKAFSNYLSEKSSKLEEEVNNMNQDIDSIRNNIDMVQKEINNQQKVIDNLNAMIEKNNETIQRIQGVIEQLKEDIKQTELDIEKRDKQIKDRMRSEQVSIGTNVYIEFMMGAKDLVDMVRIADGIERITENDQDEIKALEADKEKLDQQKAEQDRLMDDQEKAKQRNVENKAVAQKAKAEQEKLQVEWRKQEADLLEKIRSASAANSAVQSQIAVLKNVHYQQSDGWIHPVPGMSYVSAGTWAYPGGGSHMGMDFAAGVGTAIRAPIGGVILYANNPAPTYGGYLGNWVGHPAGGGNTVQLVGTVKGTTYAVSFFHMAQENFAASPGAGVAQGTYLGGVGHSGNSTGAHLHLEIINLGDMSVDEAIDRFRANGADFAWGTGWNSTATSCGVKGYAPCRERPEDFIGY